MWAVAIQSLFEVACLGALFYFARANRKLVVQAERDVLTGLYNRRAFVRLAEVERKRSRRHRRPLSLAFIDLDDFKRVNDEMGHLEGDRVLTSFSQILQGGRGSDVAARLGGDEFVLLMPETDRDAAVAAIDRIRWRATLEPGLSGSGVAFTTGIAAFTSAPESVDALLEAADRLLREAKHSRKSSVRSDAFRPSTYPSTTQSVAHLQHEEGTTMRNDMNENPKAREMTRRQLLDVVAVSLAAAPFAHLAACSSTPLTADQGSGGGAGSAGGASNETDAGAEAQSGSTGDAGAWATGGTASIKGGYADPFAEGLGATCALACAATLGPCYAQTIVRKDISEGHDGLPARMAFLVVDETCKPVEGATIDIWHTAPEGVYSGNDASQMCTLGNAAAVASRFFRGVQTTDAAGRADFDTCFPGWYSGRTIHVHFTVRLNGTEYVTSQLFFDDTLEDEIIASQPLYNDRGARDTRNTNDGVISASAVADYTFHTKRMDDGVMMAWKTLVIRSSPASALCSVPGGSMMGGPPP
jgi:diguanylate cyclase (GGDEF)-like protein